VAGEQKSSWSVTWIESILERVPASRHERAAQYGVACMMLWWDFRWIGEKVYPSLMRGAFIFSLSAHRKTEHKYITCRNALA